jgi:cysteinyl-tRNA synthetase
MNANTIKMYVCGPTVYDSSHLGHARTYVTVDIIHRVLELYMHEKTFLVMNITDIDDKIIDKATESNCNWREVAIKNEKSFFDSMAKLNVRYPNVVIRVSEVLPQIINYIQKIIDNGFAYVSDGSVYFDTDAYIKAGYKFDGTVDDEEHESDNTNSNTFLSNICENIINQKKNKKDFALWKGRSIDEVGFDAEFIYDGQKNSCFGRPGWHIECSAMIHETIGPKLDIHLGGIDLKFPHHHNEILQAHAFYHPMFKSNFENETWPSKFIHTGHLCIQGLKMSKSLKNFTTIDEALKSVNANQLRWLFILHKWHEPMDFSDNTVEQAKIYDIMINNFFNRALNYPYDRSNLKYVDKEIKLSDYFDSMKNLIFKDLIQLKFDSVSISLAELINKTNTYISLDGPNEFLVKKISNWIMYLVELLGFVYNKTATNSESAQIMNVLIHTRTAFRNMTRGQSIPKEVKQKIFEILDEERNVKLKEIGVTLTDTKDSSMWFIN